MSSPQVERAQQWLRAQESHLLADFQSVLRIPSIEADPLPNAPFGQANRDALDFALDLGKQWGMQTKDLDGYCGYAEFGSGEKLICIFGHLDVVPVGAGWKYDPFSATIDGGYVYARGATDDKGPTIAAFYAAKALMELGEDLGCRIRVVFGCNEESGFKCIEHYVAHDEAPTFGVAPDAGWPLIHAEKGIANMVFRLNAPKSRFQFVSLEGGQRPNIVIDAAVGKILVANEVRAEVEEKLAKQWDKNLSWHWEGDTLVINALGKAAHGSTPYFGDNAAARVLRFAAELAPAEEQEFWGDLFHTTHPSGLGLGIDGADEFTSLTSNLGVVEMKNGVCHLTFNIRYPVTWKGETLKTRSAQKLAEDGLPLELAEFEDSVPLFFPLDHPLVKTVVDVYAEETGEHLTPGVMGGGTYARAVPNSVAIGTGWVGDGKAHQTDERLKIENLYKMSRIYAHIFYRLTKA